MAALLFVVVLTTGFRFSNGPIFDDVAVLEISGVIHQPKRALEAFGQPTMFISTRPIDAASIDTYRPIPVLSFFLNSVMSKQKLWAYHLTNLVLHATCVLLLFAFIRRWLGGGKIKAAALSSAFFALHPWLAEAHVWINGRSDPFALAFGLGSALVLFRREATPKRLALAGLLFLGGLLSKETLLPTLPAFLFLGYGTLTLRDRLVRLAPLGAATVIYLVMRLRVLHGMKTHQDDHTLKEAMLRGPAIVFDAIWQIFVPTFPFLRSLRDDLNAVPRPLFYVAGAALAFLLLFVFRMRKRWKGGPFITLFFVGSLAPIAGISVVLWPGYGRYLYLPAAAAAIALAEFIVWVSPRLAARWKEGKKVGAAFIFLYLCVQATFLISFTTDMGSDETLYLAAAERRPHQAYAWGALGLSYAYHEQDIMAIGALKKAVSIAPNQQRYTSQLAAVYARNARCDESRTLAMSALPRFKGPDSLATLHVALALCSTEPESATMHTRQCLLLRPKREDCKQLLTSLLATPKTGPRVRVELRRLRDEAPDATFDNAWSSAMTEPE